MNPIKHAIDVVGNASILARQLGVTTQAVCFWRDGLRRIPAEKCPSIERVTAGAVRCEVLRPDVEWGFIRATCLPISA
jgi:DNA-binding transcriptional regulator YdaS (Cro superfamily)